MTSLLEDLRNAPTPLSLTSREPLLSAVKSAVIELFRAGTTIHSEGLSFETVSILRRYSLWLEEIALNASIPDTGHFALASELAELAGTFTEPGTDLSIFTSPLNDLLRSAMLTSMLPYQASAPTSSDHILDMLENIMPSSTVTGCHLLVAQIVTALVGRYYRHAIDLFNSLRRSINSIANTVVEENISPVDYSALDRALAIGMAAGRVAVAMYVAVPELIIKALQQLNDIRNSAVKYGDVQHEWLAERLWLVANQMYQTSAARLLAQVGISHEYRRSLARDEIFELWEPQREALRKGIADPRAPFHFVISVPTGAGKTLFAELALAAVLRTGTNGWAIYVVPTRALVSQISNGLRRRLSSSGIVVRTILAGAEQSIVLEEELDLLAEKRTVTVTTPEKLDAYLRNAPELFGSCRLSS